MPFASTARLIDRTNGSILWANSYDGSRTVRRLLDMEGDVAGDVATALGQPYGIIFQADAAQAPQGPPEEWDAYACTLAYYSYRMVLDQPTHASVKQCLERAVAALPRLRHRLGSSCRSWISTSCASAIAMNATAPSPLDQAIDAARRAVALDPTNVAGSAGTNAQPLF